MLIVKLWINKIKLEYLEYLGPWQLPSVKQITRTAYFHLRNIAKIRPILSTVDADTLIHAFTVYRLG